MSNCNNDILLLEVKQGESRGFGFTITKTVNNSEVPFNLANCIVDFEVRKTPYQEVKPILSKQITELETVDGYIYSPYTGEFKVNITQEDLQKLPPDDYYLSIYINQDGSRFSISGDGNNTSILRFCQC